MNTQKLRTLATVTAIAAAGALFAGCTTTRPGDSGTNTSSRASIDAQVDASL